MAGYYDEVAALMSAASPEEDEEEKDPGTATLAQAGTPGTGRYSENGNELPEGLHSRRNPSNMPDATPTPQQPIPATVTADGSGTSTVSPDDARQKQNDDNVDLAVKRQFGNLEIGDQAVRDLSRMPTEQQTLEPLEEKLQQAQTPPSYRQRAYDPNQPISPTNQPGQENYNPSVGGRILRGVEGFARGGVWGAVDPKLVGVKPYGAPNDNYDREVARRANAAKNVGERIKRAQESYKAAETHGKDVQAAAQSQSLGYSRIPTAVTGQENARTAQVNAQTSQSREYNNSPEGKAEADRQKLVAVMDQRAKSAPKFLKPGTAQYEQWMLNGRVNFATPRTATEGEISQNKALSVFKKEHDGRGPETMDEYADLVAQSKGQPKASTKTSETQYRDAIRVHQNAQKELTAAQNALAKTFNPKDKPGAQERVKKAQSAVDTAQNAMGDLAEERTPGLPTPPPAVAGDAVEPPPNAAGEVRAKDGTLLGYTVKGQKGYTPLSKLKKKKK